jgi:4-hydroxy-2-oxoheptanedioate aldolase
MTMPDTKSPIALRSQNRLKAALAAGEVGLCMRTVLARTTEIAFMAEAAGLDAFYMDLEHCTASLGEVGAICATATAIGMTALVRVPAYDDPSITKLLDAGAAGIIAPHVDTAAQARAVVDACTFAPLGRRSASGPAFQFGYAGMPLAEQARRVNEATLVAVMLETALAIRNAGEIAAVPGVDMLLIGTNDLGLDLGIPGAHGAEPIVAAYRSVAEACRNDGKTLGIAGIGDRDLLAQYVALGARFISVGTDAGFLLAGMRARAADLRTIGTSASKAHA